MKTFRVEERRYTLTDLYRISAGSKPRRGLFGYMLKTGRPDNPIFGGAMSLLCSLDTLEKNEVYSIIKETNEETATEIMAVAEAALAGCFREYEISVREINRTLTALDKLPPIG